MKVYLIANYRPVGHHLHSSDIPFLVAISIVLREDDRGHWSNVKYFRFICSKILRSLTWAGQKEKNRLQLLVGGIRKHGESVRRMKVSPSTFASTRKLKSAGCSELNQLKRCRGLNKLKHPRGTRFNFAPHRRKWLCKFDKIKQRAVIPSRRCIKTKKFRIKNRSALSEIE